MTTKVIRSKLIIENEEVERFAEVPVEKEENWGPDKKFRYVGKPLNRTDGNDKVTGRAAYTFDISFPGMLFAKTLRSKLPHIKIKSINTKKAEKLEGVAAILHSGNSPEIKWYRNTSKIFDNTLRFEGDEIACVAAITEKIADEALKLIEIEYEELPFVISATEAMDEKSPNIMDGPNSGKAREYSRGDVDKAYAEADLIVEDEFSTAIVIHNPTEVHCSVAKWVGSTLELYDSTQAIFGVRSTVAKSLDLPESKVRVIKKFMGGGFGSKLEAGKYNIMAALLSKKTGKPVKILMDRKEMNLAVGNRPDSYQKLKAACTKEGKLTALEHYSYGAVGPFPGGAGCATPLRSVYLCPNVRTKEFSVRTNTGPERPFRAPGHVQGTFALEMFIDEVAEKAGIDPLEFRQSNYAEISPEYNIPFTSKYLREAYIKGSEAIGWKNRNKIAGNRQGPVKEGIGMATQIWWGGGGPPAYATLKLNRDGSCKVLAGTQDIGCGTYTILAQVAAETLEIPMEDVEVILGDTGTTPYCPQSGGSMTAPSVSPAVKNAAELMKQKLISSASAILNIADTGLEYADGKVSSKKGDKSLAIKDIIKKLDLENMVTMGARNNNPEGYMLNTFGAQFAKVRVDTETGKVEVVKIVAAHDIGRVLNQKTLENQFHGGIIQGLGYALLEERIIDKYTGKILTDNLHDYKMPTIKDTPEIEIHIVSEPDNLISAVGAKGIGEPAIIPTAGAIANAVYNAIGVRIKSLPITPDKVLNALYNS